MGLVAAWIACRQSGHFGLQFVERGGESPKVVELPAIDFHDSPPLIRFDTFYEFADARKLGRIGCGDPLRLSRHLRLEKTEKAKQDGVFRFARLRSLSRRPGRQQY